jgi:hypothetical protein
VFLRLCRFRVSAFIAEVFWATSGSDFILLGSLADPVGLYGREVDIRVCAALDATLVAELLVSDTLFALVTPRVATLGRCAGVILAFGCLEVNGTDGVVPVTLQRLLG